MAHFNSISGSMYALIVRFLTLFYCPNYCPNYRPKPKRCIFGYKKGRQRGMLRRRFWCNISQAIPGTGAAFIVGLGGFWGYWQGTM